jgi:predicted peptidase
MKIIQGKFSRTLTKKISGECYVFQPEIEGPWPVVFWLHGGDSADRILETNSPPGLAYNGKEYPFLLIAPLCHQQHWDVLELEALLDDIEEDYPIDKDRVYVTGRSMGGTGTYTFAAHCHDRIAAIAPICARNLTAYAHKLSHIPVQMHHSKDDRIVPFDDAIQMHNQLLFNNAEIVELVRYNGYGHGTFDPNHVEESFNQILGWLMMHKRQEPSNLHKFKFI